uniref:Uncharacterized protein n=1 Tax=Timema genevievae TaxID=629358 RepID=A0A7R9PLT3_TIMGE|nr:unnamed protein product [Timema genevievae]
MGLHDFGVKECKLEIKNTRSQYWHEVGKIRSSTASGCSGDSVYKPSAVWFTTVDGFLRRLAIQNTESNLKRKAKHSVSSQQNNTNIGEYDDPPSVEENVESASVPIPPQAGPVPLHRKRKSASSQKDPPHHVQQALSKLQAISATAATFKETEFDLWTKSLAIHLNNLDVGRALELQLKLQTMVSEERIAHEYSTRNYSHPTQPPASHLAQIELQQTSRASMFPHHYSTHIWPSTCDNSPCASGSSHYSMGNASSNVQQMSEQTPSQPREPSPTNSDSTIDTIISSLCSP